MNIDIKPGTYVVAVSGGVDSVVLLDLLIKKYESSVVSRQISVTDNRKQITDNSVRFVIAHYDHGIREDSQLDRKFVQELAAKYNLPFVYDKGDLGPKASEATARDARYKFLNKVKDLLNANAIITAHHQDDVIETAIINLLRGTNRKGLTSLRSRPGIVRPLLEVSKNEIISYAKVHKLKWREDSTNQDTKYLRNHIRRNILPQFSTAQRVDFLKHIDDLKLTNNKIDKELSSQFQSQTETKTLDRQWFTLLPHIVAREVLASWLKQNNILSADKKILEQLVIAAKTLTKGKRSDINARCYMLVEKDKLVLTQREQ